MGVGSRQRCASRVSPVELERCVREAVARSPDIGARVLLDVYQEKKRLLPTKFKAVDIDFHSLTPRTRGRVYESVRKRPDMKKRAEETKKESGFRPRARRQWPTKWPSNVASLALPPGDLTVEDMLGDPAPVLLSRDKAEDVSESPPTPFFLKDDDTSAETILKNIACARTLFDGIP